MYDTKFYHEIFFSSNEKINWQRLLKDDKLSEEALSCDNIPKFHSCILGKSTTVDNIKNHDLLEFKIRLSNNAEIMLYLTQDSSAPYVSMNIYFQDIEEFITLYEIQNSVKFLLYSNYFITSEIEQIDIPYYERKMLTQEASATQRTMSITLEDDQTIDLSPLYCDNENPVQSYKLQLKYDSTPRWMHCRLHSRKENHIMNLLVYLNDNNKIYIKIIAKKNAIECVYDSCMPINRDKVLSEIEDFLYENSFLQGPSKQPDHSIQNTINKLLYKDFARQVTEIAKVDKEILQDTLLRLPKEEALLVSKSCNDELERYTTVALKADEKYNFSAILNRYHTRYDSFLDCQTIPRWNSCMIENIIRHKEYISLSIILNTNEKMSVHVHQEEKNIIYILYHTEHTIYPLQDIKNDVMSLLVENDLIQQLTPECLPNTPEKQEPQDSMSLLSAQDFDAPARQTTKSISEVTIKLAKEAQQL